MNTVAVLHPEGKYSETLKPDRLLDLTYNRLYFSHIYLCTVEFNSSVRHSKTLVTIINNKLGQLYQNTVIKVN